jgi:hypothetical protein
VVAAALLAVCELLPIGVHAKERATRDVIVIRAAAAVDMAFLA